MDVTNPEGAQGTPATDAPVVKDKAYFQSQVAQVVERLNTLANEASAVGQEYVATTLRDEANTYLGVAVQNQWEDSTDAEDEGDQGDEDEPEGDEPEDGETADEMDPGPRAGGLI